jgi:hypothetical protein
MVLGAFIWIHDWLPVSWAGWKVVLFHAAFSEVYIPVLRLKRFMLMFYC